VTDDVNDIAGDAGLQDTADEVEELISEAESLGADDRWDEAQGLLLNALETHPDDALLLCWAGIASERMGSDGEAYELFRRSLAQQPTDPFILAAAGTGIAVFDDPDAESALRLAAITAPDFPLARSAYGSYLAREGLFEQALVELRAARDLAPDDGHIRAELGLAALLARRSEEGLGELEEALSHLEDDSWLRGVFGLALLEGGQAEEGAEQLFRAVQERPEDMELQLLGALAFAEQGWEDEAWNAVARAEASAEALDRDVIREVEEAVEAGPEEAGSFLREQLGPSLLRERLSQRG
jgi:tetratricopeptide (TPR) repeat protein